MNSRVKELVDRLKKFNDEVITFVKECSDADWQKMCAWEQWPVGVTARHIGAGHYQAVAMARMIIEGKKLPEYTAEQITEMANQHAREHAGCIKEDVLGVLEKNGRKMIEFVSGLEASQLDLTGYLPMMNEDVTVEQLIETVVFVTGGEHFDNIKAAVAR